MTEQTETNIQDDQIKRPAEIQGFAKLWWLNIVRGAAALAIGIGLLLPFELPGDIVSIHWYLPAGKRNHESVLGPFQPQKARDMAPGWCLRFIRRHCVPSKAGS